MLSNITSPARIAQAILKEAYAVRAERTAQGKSCPAWITCSRPYLEALCTCDTVNSTYMQEDARSIIRYTLCNLTGWKGPVARTAKTALRNLIGE